MAHEQLRGRTIQLHKFPPLQKLNSIPPAALDAALGLGPALDAFLGLGYHLRGRTLESFHADLWRCRLANLDWAYGETKELAMERAYKRWSHRGRRPSWER